MKYSICIPVYNMARTIEGCVRSALVQTYRGDFEVLLLDNGSTDGTYERAGAIVDPRFRCIRNEHNLGAYGNHNRCLELARGDWIKFLHGDDDLLLSCLERFDHHLGACPPSVRLLACGAVHEGENGRREQRTVVPPRLFITKAAKLGDFVLAGNVVGTPTMTSIHRQTMIDSGGFDVSTEPGADGDAWLMLRQKFAVAFLPEHLVVTRDDPRPDIARRGRFLARWIDYQIRLVEKWRRLDAETAQRPLGDSIYGRWLVQDISLAWRAAAKYAFCGHPKALILLIQRLGQARALGASLAFVARSGHNLSVGRNFRREPFWRELAGLELQ